MTEAIRPNPLVEQRRARIKDLGFNPIGKTNLYQVRDGGMVVSVDPKTARYTFLVDFDRQLYPPHVKALTVADYTGTEALHVLSGDELLMPCIQGGVMLESLSNAESEKTKLNQLSSIPLVDQLAQAGFDKDAQNSDMWKRDFLCQYEGASQEVIVHVEDGNLSRILKPLPPSRYKPHKIDEATEIVEVRQEQGRSWMDKYDVITLHEGYLSLDLSTHIGGRIDNIQPTRELSPQELKVESYSPHPDTSTPEFMVGGVNSTELIRSITAFNGRPLADIEKDMRPTKNGDMAKTSVAGFLGADESLVDVLAQDNDFVRGLGLTHEDMAFPLKYIRRFYELGFGKSRAISGIKDTYFTLGGNKYQLTTTQNLGSQGSPFRDGTFASSIFSVKNLSNGESISGSMLHTDMIERWGFYEGKGTSFRLEPEAILKVFPYLQELSKERVGQ